jgi:magnesium transporter
MITTHEQRGITWLDLESPNDQEIAGLVRRYGLHPLVGEELKSSPSQAKIDFYKDYVMVILTVPVRIRQDGGYTIADREIDFVIGKDFLITSRSEKVDELEYFSRIFDANAILNKNESMKHAGHLFYYIVMRLYGGMVNDLENIKDTLQAAELGIFKGNERGMVEVLSRVSRELIDFTQTARVHRDIWDEMIEFSPKDLFGAEYADSIKEIRDEFNRIHELVANARELLTDLRATNDSLLNTKQNEIIKVLTLVAFVFQPLTFVAALFTIPALYVPFIDQKEGWIIIAGIMITMAFGIWTFFKSKKWI